VNPTNSYSMYTQQAFQQSLKLIAEAVQGEKEDQIFYNYLIANAPTQEQKEIITTIRNDEIHHNQLFKKMYKDLTGKEVILENEEEVVPPASFEQGIKKAILGEMKAMEKYRVIRQGLPHRYHRDIVFSILTDELKHGTLYNLIYTEVLTGSTKEDEEESLERNPDEWLQYTKFLIKEGLNDVARGKNSRSILQEYILMGVLVGQGYSPEEAYETVENWERTGKSKLLQPNKNKRKN
jgi:rubrerythrin